MTTDVLGGWSDELEKTTKDLILDIYWKTSFEKNWVFFCVGE